MRGYFFHFSFICHKRLISFSFSSRFFEGVSFLTHPHSLWDKGFQQGGFDQYLSYWSESKHFFWNKALYVVPLQNLMNTIGSRSLVTFSYHIVMRIMSIWFGELACLH